MERCAHYFASVGCREFAREEASPLADQVAHSARVPHDEMGGYPGVACRRRLPEGTGGFNLPSGRFGSFQRIVGRLSRRFHERRQDSRPFFLPQFLHLRSAPSRRLLTIGEAFLQLLTVFGRPNRETPKRPESVCASDSSAASVRRTSDSSTKDNPGVGPLQ
jgi:hypothetical protein